MKNSFDIEVCFKSAPINYYEWDNSTQLLHIKAIRVSRDCLRNILLYEGSIETKSGILLLSDTANSIVVKLNKEGKIVKRSFLKYDDDMDVCEFAHSLKVTNINFHKEDKKVKYSNTLSIEDELKRYIIKSLEDSMDEGLSRYLYYLYFDRVEDYSIKKLINAVKTSNIDKNMKLYKFLIES